MFNAYLIFCIVFGGIGVFYMLLGAFNEIASWFKKKPPTPPKDHSKDYF